MEILYVIALSLGSIVAIFILTKLMGYRQMSQMSMFDYINGITIGSIAAEMATSLEENFVQPLVAMIVYAMSALMLSWIGSKSIRARRVIEGKPLVLMDHGKLYRENLKKAKIDVTEFLVQCRVNGYFDEYYAGISSLLFTFFLCRFSFPSFFTSSRHSRSPAFILTYYPKVYLKSKKQRSAICQPLLTLL